MIRKNSILQHTSSGNAATTTATAAVTTGATTHSITDIQHVPDTMAQSSTSSSSQAQIRSIKKDSNDKTKYMISSLFAGIGSGAISSVACAPLDLVRTRLQVMGSLSEAEKKASSVGVGENPKNISLTRALKDVYTREGFKGCFRGLGSTLLTVPFFWGLYFPLYEHLKENVIRDKFSFCDDDSSSFIKLSPDGQKAMEHMTSAIMAGAVADFACNPMFVVRTRMQTEALHIIMNTSPKANQKIMKNEKNILSISGTIKSLYIEGGIPIFWRGLTASLMGLSHVAVQFPVYERLKQEARRINDPINNQDEGTLGILLASGLSKITASLLTYPHEVIRSRMMDARGPAGSANLGLVNTLRGIIQKEGYLSLYTGLHVSLARVVPNCCITFVSYELFLKWANKQFE